ncbi:accessory factor UbiK family protein [Gilvimarinus sp. 1_MG-2023]
MQTLAEQLFNELKQRIPSLDEVPTPNVKAALNRAISKMDLVSREEFDAQAAVLARTRERLEALERQVAQLEQNTP